MRPGCCVKGTESWWPFLKENRRGRGKAKSKCRLLAQVLLFAPGDGQRGERGNVCGKKEFQKSKEEESGRWEGSGARSLSWLPGWSSGIPFPALLFLFPRDARDGRWVGMGVLEALSPQQRILAHLLLKKNVGSFPFRSQPGGRVAIRMGLCGACGESLRDVSVAGVSRPRG